QGGYRLLPRTAPRHSRAGGGAGQCLCPLPRSHPGRPRSRVPRGAADRRLRAAVPHRRALQGGHQRGGQPGQGLWPQRGPPVHQRGARQGGRRQPQAGNSRGPVGRLTGAAVALHEFDLIRRFFTVIGGAGPHIALGVGDDGALLDQAPGCQLAISTDTLVEGVHFPVACDPEALAGRALRVNLSDLAAMGAEPLGFQLALTLPSADEVWLAAFSRGLARDAGLFGCPLMGGDTTRGPLAITVTVIGTLPAGAALRRGGAGAGDLLYVTGTLGDARGALDVPREAHLAARYWRPEPRLAAGRLLRQFASAALDVSDGLAQDAGHIAAASGLGCRIEADRLPL